MAEPVAALRVRRLPGRGVQRLLDPEEPSRLDSAHGVGEEIHPLGHPDKVLLDFTSYDYEVAWGEKVVSELDHDGFTGVNVVDAGNLPLWDGVPVVRNSDLPANRVLDDAARSRQLAKALSIVHAVLLTNGYLLAAPKRGPATGGGFARLSGEAWSELFDYFQVAFADRGGAVVWDDRRPMTDAQRI